MVGQLVLVQPIGVRIPASEPTSSTVRTTISKGASVFALQVGIRTGRSTMTERKLYADKVACSKFGAAQGKTHRTMWRDKSLPPNQHLVL